MHGIAVALLADDRDRLSSLQRLADASSGARIVFSHIGFPAAATDPVLRQLQDLRAEVVLVDVDTARPQRAVGAIELLKNNTNDLGIFAVGEMHNPASIVAAMRAGACEYLERSSDPVSLQEALSRFASSKTHNVNAAGRARVLTFMNAKGGSGATTLAVNTALALQQEHGSTVLVDFAALGHAALHLNVRPVFGLSDALQNLHRMDAALLAGFMTVCRRDLDLLAGSPQLSALTPTTSELARLFDLLVTHYKYVVVDCSSRMDELSRIVGELSHKIMLVAQTDVVTLWSCSRIHAWLEQSGAHAKVGLILNRHKKIPGFSDEDVARATNSEVFWKAPNSYHPVASGIDRGEPIIFQDSELSRSIRALAALLAKSDADADNSRVAEKSGMRPKATARLLISPLRAGQ